MKTLSLGSILLKVILVLLTILLFTYARVNAQESSGSNKKQQYSIHILKEVNGVKTEIDTSFESDEDFDVQSWIDDHDTEIKEPGEGKSIQREFRITIPDFQAEAGKIPDTIIINGDTVITGIGGMDMEAFFKDMPDMETFKEFDKQKFFEAPTPDDEFRDNPRYHEWEYRNQDHFTPRCPSLHGFNIPGLEEFLPLGDLDKIVVEKKRHGKKIIIRFEDREPRHMKQNRKHTYYFNDDLGMAPGDDSKVVIRHLGKPVRIEESEEQDIQRIKDGDKEVIIIRKKE